MSRLNSSASGFPDFEGRAIEKCPENIHVEARYHQRLYTQVRMDKRQLKLAVTDDFAGIGIRVLVDGAWGYASTSKMDKASVDNTLDNAISAAKTLARSKKEKIELAPIKPVKVFSL